MAYNIILKNSKPFWTIGGSYTYHTKDAQAVFLKYASKYILKNERPDAEIIDVLFSVWKDRDWANRHDAHRTSFVLFGCDTLRRGGALSRLKNGSNLQREVNAMRVLYNLPAIY